MARILITKKEIEELQGFHDLALSRLKEATVLVEMIDDRINGMKVTKMANIPITNKEIEKLHRLHDFAVRSLKEANVLAKMIRDRLYG
jgi:serine/threonine-protein kinase RIO1